MDSQKLNAVYSSPRMKRRYEVWFLRFGLSDGSGAWWLRYLLLNLGRRGCTANPAGMPAQVWATWFPRQGTPQTFIQGFALETLKLSGPHELLSLRIAGCGIEDGACWGNVRADGHDISWKLNYRSRFGALLSHKGWIGFCKSPHSDAVFSGEILFDGRPHRGEPLGLGVQGHNCGYRYRTYWRWMHAHFVRADGDASTMEALVYDMPFGLVFRNAVWWHNTKPLRIRRIQEKEIVNDSGKLKWVFAGVTSDGSPIEVRLEALAPEIHHVPYTKTDCSGTFPVANASLAHVQVRFGKNLGEALEARTGAVLEMGGT